MPYRNDQDETPVLLSLAGEETAYEVLVKRYQRAVLAAAHAVVHNDFLAENAAQDAFVTAWIKLDSLHEPKKFGAWVCRIAKNCSLNLLRRYRGFLPLDTVENYDLVGEESPADSYLRYEEGESLQRSVERLPQKVGEVIHMHYFEGLSVVDPIELAKLIEYEWVMPTRLAQQDMYMTDLVLPPDLYVFDPEMNQMLAFTHENEDWGNDETDESRICYAYGFDNAM